jgi:NADH:ubiquinone oxidoreductase subunit 2 (subunit N)
MMPPGFAPIDFWYLLPEIVLTATALVVLSADALLAKAKEGVTLWISVVGLAATAVAVLAVGGAGGTTAAGGLVGVDAFGAFFKLLFLGAAVLTLLMSLRYLTVEGARPAPTASSWCARRSA